jgi:importin subunit alpha-1
MQFTNQHWDSIVSSLFSQDILQQHYGIIGIRKLLSIEDKPPIQQVIDAQLVPVLILYAQQNQYPQLKFEALWALTNVASGTTSQTKVVVDKGGITLFVGCLYSPVLAIV